MSFVKSSKQLNTAAWNKNASFGERWRRWRAAFWQVLPISNTINCRTKSELHKVLYASYKII